MSPWADLDTVLATLRASKKYSGLADAALQRVAAWAVARHRSTREASKAAKRKLHQVHGAYFDGKHLSAIDCALDRIGVADVETKKSICSEVLSLHASTAERSEILGSLYRAVFDVTGVPRSIIDVGCGLHPFGLPWMGLDSDCRYTAMDVDERLAARLDRFLGIMGQNARVYAGDILSDGVAEAADVALFMKVAPCFEQQSSGAFREILMKTQAAWSVVTFPVASLGGRDVGMRQHYERFIEEIGATPAARIDFSTELVYVFRAI